MSARAVRLTLLALLVAVACAALPALADAAIAPTLTLGQSAGTTAASSAGLGFGLSFASTSGDAPKDAVLALPGGLLANADADNGACLTSTSPLAQCQIGSGSATALGLVVPFDIYLVQAPHPRDVAGALLSVVGLPIGTGDITLRTQPDIGLDISIASLPAGLGVTELNFTLSSLRLPSSCPTPAANVVLNVDSQLAPTTVVSAAAPLVVTGCGSLPYAPVLTSTVTKDANDNGAEIVSRVTQAADESANRAVEIDMPSSLSPNVAAAASCLSGQPCTVGSAAALSPVLPASALAHGVVTLGGSLAAPTFTISFPAPFLISLSGVANLINDSITFDNVPDVPLTSLSITLAGTAAGKLFTTTCQPSTVTGHFTPQDGNPTVTSTASIAYSGCSVKPSVSGSLSGLASGHPKLVVKLKRATLAPNLASVSLGLPSGLKFTPVKQGKSLKGLSLAGAPVKTAYVKGGRLLISFRKPAAGAVAITANARLLAVTSPLQRKAKHHQLGKLSLSVKVTGVDHRTQPVTLELKARVGRVPAHDDICPQDRGYR